MKGIIHLRTPTLRSLLEEIAADIADDDDDRVDELGMNKLDGDDDRSAEGGDTDFDYAALQERSGRITRSTLRHLIKEELGRSLLSEQGSPPEIGTIEISTSRDRAAQAASGPKKNKKDISRDDGGQMITDAIRRQITKWKEDNALTAEMYNDNFSKYFESLEKFGEEYGMQCDKDYSFKFNLKFNTEGWNCPDGHPTRCENETYVDTEFMFMPGRDMSAARGSNGKLSDFVKGLVEAVLEDPEFQTGAEAVALGNSENPGITGFSEPLEVDDNFGLKCRAGTTEVDMGTDK